MSSWEFSAKEVKLWTLREQPMPDDLSALDTAERAAEYYRQIIQTGMDWRQEQEQFHVVHLNVRCRAISHTLVAMGTLDTITIHPREVFRAAIVAGSAAILLFHNHPSGDPTPSDADVRATRDMIRAGQLLRVEVKDHIIIGQGLKPYLSLRKLGYFNQ